MTISWPSAEPSASTITMMSPVQAANPVIRASPLPLPALLDDLDAGPQVAGDLDGVVGGVAVDEDHFVDPVGQCLEDVRKVLRLVHGGDHHAHRWRDRQVGGDRPVHVGRDGCGSATRLLARNRRAQNGTHESVPSRPVDRPPLGGPAYLSGSKGGFSLTACRMDSSVSAVSSMPGELAKLAEHHERGRFRGTARRDIRSTEHGTPLPRPAPTVVVAILSPPLSHRMMDRCGWMYDGIDDCSPYGKTWNEASRFCWFDRYSATLIDFWNGFVPSVSAPCPPARRAPAVTAPRCAAPGPGPAAPGARPPPGDDVSPTPRTR